MHELETTVNSELAQVQEWLTLNQLTLNIKKTNFIIFKSHKKRLRRDLRLTLNGTVLQRVENSKFLGIVIDQHLTLKNHIDYITTKQGRNMVYGLRAQSPKYEWDQGSEERAQGSEEWDQGSQGF